MDNSQFERDNTQLIGSENDRKFLIKLEQVELGSTTHLSSDTFGLRPVYYVQAEKKVTYADHIAPLLRVLGDRQPNPTSIQGFLSGEGYDYSETFFKGVKRLPPSHELTCDSTGLVKVNQNWAPDFSTLIRNQVDISLAAARTRELLLEAVESSIGDFQDAIGVGLSGGMDSSSVLACVKKVRPNAQIKTFTVVISDYNQEDAELSEMMAKEFATEHCIIRPGEEEFWDELSDFVRCQEEPVPAINTYCDWKVFQQVKNANVNKLLGGTGGDSALLGTDHYLTQYWITLLKQKEYLLLLTSMLSFYDFALRLIGRNGILFVKNRKQAARVISERGLLQKENADNLLSEGVSSNFSGSSWSSLPYDLQSRYKNATYYGIENQEPFLHLPLMEYLLALPLDCKFQNGYTKYVLREAMKPLLPKTVVRRRRKGIAVDPVYQWVNGPLRDKLHDFFSSQSLKGTEYYDLSQVHELLAKKMARSECGYVWRVLNLEVWLQEFF